MASRAPIPSLIDVTPPETLRFALTSPFVEPKTTIKVSNVTTNKLAFKIKTTHPKRFFVRPNQGLISENGSETVTVTLVEKDCRELLTNAASSSPESTPDRFLIMSMRVADDVYERLMKISSEKLRTEELQRLWDSSKKEESQKKKLEVKYDYPENLQQVVALMNAETPEKADGPRMSNLDTHTHTYNSLSEAPGSPEAIFADLQKTRKKYDDVVEYTVTLTAERDMLNAKVEELEMEIARLRNRAGEREGFRVKGKLGDARIAQGFHLYQIILCSFVFFLLGNFINWGRA